MYMELTIVGNIIFSNFSLKLTVKRAVGFVGLKFSTNGIHGRGGGGPAVTEIEADSQR